MVGGDIIFLIVMVILIACVILFIWYLMKRKKQLNRIEEKLDQAAELIQNSKTNR